MRSSVLSLLAVLMLTACYNRKPVTSEALELTEAQMDSLSFYSTHHYTQNFNFLSFYSTHHYTQNFNFLVKADSLHLKYDPNSSVSPEFIDENTLAVDSVTFFRGDHIVVADIKTIPSDSIDSVWVKVARDQVAMGDPISVFIDTFSNKHLLFFLALLVLVGSAYGLRKLHSQNAYIIHFNDIPSYYPTVLAVLVAASATFYSSIQLFGPETWRHFYYHPTLNPFVVPQPLRGALPPATVPDVGMGDCHHDDSHDRRCAPPPVALRCRALPPRTRRRLCRALRGVQHHHALLYSDAVLYLLGLAGVCAVLYVVFSITTLYYIGYPLLVAYIVFAFSRKSL